MILASAQIAAGFGFGIHDRCGFEGKLNSICALGARAGKSRAQIHSTELA